MNHLVLPSAKVPSKDVLQSVPCRQSNGQFFILGKYSKMKTRKFCGIRHFFPPNITLSNQIVIDGMFKKERQTNLLKVSSFYTLMDLAQTPSEHPPCPDYCNCEVMKTRLGLQAVLLCGAFNLIQGKSTIKARLVLKNAKLQKNDIQTDRQKTNSIYLILHVLFLFLFLPEVR